MKRTPLTIIFLIVFIDLLGFGIVIPILPSYAERGFGASDVMVGFLVASFSFAQLIFTPIWGRLSDRVGRRPILMIGLVLSAIGYGLFGIAHSLEVLFISRLLGGIGGANISAAQAYIADVTAPHERARGMGLIGAAFGLGFVFGPFMGGVLVEFGYLLPGLVAAALSLIALVATAVLLPESVTRGEAGTNRSLSWQAMRAALSRPITGVLLLLFFLATFAYANIYATFPMISTRDFGYTEREVGYLFGYIGIIGALVQGWLIRVLTRRIPERRLFTIGAACTMAGLTALPFTGPLVAMLSVLTVLSIGTGLLTPSMLSLISNSAEANEQGGVLGVNQAMGALARVLGPIWGGFVFQSFGHVWPFLTGGIVMLLVLAIARKTL